MRKLGIGSVHAIQTLQRSKSGGLGLFGGVQLLQLLRRLDICAIIRTTKLLAQTNTRHPMLQQLLTQQPLLLTKFRLFLEKFDLLHLRCLQLQSKTFSVVSQPEPLRSIQGRIAILAILAHALRTFSRARTNNATRRRFSGDDAGIPTS
jgi:hypothetical protein